VCNDRWEWAHLGALRTDAAETNLRRGIAFTQTAAGAVGRPNNTSRAVTPLLHTWAPSTERTSMPSHLTYDMANDDGYR
jgi:hypothetical protein